MSSQWHNRETVNCAHLSMTDPNTCFIYIYIHRNNAQQLLLFFPLLFFFLIIPSYYSPSQRARLLFETSLFNERNCNLPIVQQWPWQIRDKQEDECEQQRGHWKFQAAWTFRVPFPSKRKIILYKPWNSFERAPSFYRIRIFGNPKRARIFKFDGKKEVKSRELWLTWRS